MKVLHFDLYEEYSIAKSKTEIYGFLDAYLIDDGTVRPAVLVCPGGGYGMLAKHECEPVAKRFAEFGFNAFVLKYSLAPHSYPVQLAEAVMAMGFIRDRAKELCVDANKVACLGFSAGGHLASTLATIGCDDAVKSYIGREINARPNASLLVYPVINLDGEIAHGGSAENVSGGDENLKAYLSTEKRVDKNTPPTFIVTVATDDCVSCENSLRYAVALAENGVNFELHVLPDGWHGMGLGNDDPETPEDAACMDRYARWQQFAVEFLKTKHGF